MRLIVPHGYQVKHGVIIREKISWRVFTTKQAANSMEYQQASSRAISKFSQMMSKLTQTQLAIYTPLKSLLD